MKKYAVTMICKETTRAVTMIDSDSKDLEKIKDLAWAKFDSAIRDQKILEQDNFTKVELLKN